MPTAPIRDLMMYYEEKGSGDPLVLVMGLGGDLQGWAFQVPALAATFRVITFDNRGAGRTSAPDRPCTIAQMADDLAGLLDHLKLPKAHILGFSMGGAIAQEFALKYPARVNKLILVSTAASFAGATANLVRSWVDVRRSNMSREQQVRLTANWLYSADLLDDAARFEGSIKNSLANPYPQPDHAFIRQAEAVLAFDTRDRAAGIKAPTLVLAGKEDMLVAPRRTEKLAALIPGASCQSLSGGHVGIIEFAPEYNEAILAFLK
ncbi:MAG: alpha/beta fold hydrolase [Chloroflexi bacterium]|nr:alpha/beta fold hydrolase [Chloroflexota bacterium]